MNDLDFQNWLASAKVDPQMAEAISAARLSPEYSKTVDAVLGMAITEKWELKRVVGILAKRVPAIKALAGGAVAPVARVESPVIPLPATSSGTSPVRSPAPAAADGKASRAAEVRARRQAGGQSAAVSVTPSTEQAKAEGKKWSLKSLWPAKKQKPEATAAPAGKPGGKKKWWITGGVALLAVILIVVAFVYFGSGASYNYADSPSSYPSSASNDTVYPTPGASPAVTPGDNRWQDFMSLNAKSSAERGPFLDKPVLNDPNSPYYLFKHFPTRWLLWIICIPLLWTLVKQDRIAAEEVTDVNASKRGLWALFIGVMGGNLIALAINQLLVAFGIAYAVQSWPFVFIGIALNVWATWQASTSGRTDYSAVAVVGLFITGVVIIWWFTPNIYLTILGAIFMTAGIILEGKEMSRTHQGRSGLLTVLIMLLIFGFVTWLGYYLLGLVPTASAEMPLIQQFFFTALYSGRVFIGAIFGLGLAYTGGDYISTMIMPPADNGSQNIDAAKRKVGAANQDDFSVRYKINSRYDAMAFGIMILYPLITAIWFIAVIF